jgi:PAS domain S-box-containing protein
MTEMDETAPVNKRTVIAFFLPFLLGLFALCGGALACVGYLFGVRRLYDWFNNGVLIAFNPALCFFLAGTALLIALMAPRLRYVIYLLGIITSLIAFLTFVEHVAHVDLAIDTLVVSPAPGSVGRMGLPTSVTLTLIGIALVWTGFSERYRQWASRLSTAVLLIASFSLVGYLFGADQLFALPRNTGISLQSATMVAAMAIGIMVLLNEYGLAGAMTRKDAGGVLLRKLLLPIMLISIGLGWLSSLGLKAGFYDVAFGTAAGTLIEIVILLGLLWWTAKDISRSETRAREAAAAVADRDERMHGVLEALSDAFVSFDSELRFTYANAALLGLLAEYGIGGSQIFGKKAFDVMSEASDTSLGIALVRCRNEKIPVDLEDYFPPFDRWFHARYLPTRDGGVSLFALDITEQKLAAQMVTRRANELAVLYEFADKLNRADSLAEVYKCALDTITKALNCDRASILLFDNAGVMSFVASRGLSQAYQIAVTGHSPWKQGEQGARPMGIGNIAQSDVEEELRSVIMDEGIGALGFIPLISNEVLIGKFMVYYDEPHEFSVQEFELALTVGYQIAIGVERTRTEEALRENEERLRLATQTGSVGVWDWDIRANTISWTDSLYVMHGVTSDQFGGDVDAFEALIHPEDRSLVTSRMRASLENEEPYEVEFRAAKPTGGISWLYTNAMVLRDATGPYRMLGATIDITERKLAEQELAKAAAIVNSSRDAIVSKDLNGVIQSWNSGAESVFGYTADEVIGKSITILIPKDRLYEEENILAQVHRGEHISHYETIRQRKDGTLLDISLTVSPVRDANGIITGASKIARDITERRRTEAAVREREMMSRLVDAQEAERHRIARDLHDHLGQQLTALRLKLESIRVNAASHPDIVDEVAETQVYASRIDLDLNYLAWELRPTELDHLGLSDALSSFVREWSKTYGIEAEFHTSITIGGRYHPDLETNLYRIVQEALNNILKHAKADSVSVLLEQRSDLLVLIIEDNGTGFEPGARSRNGSSGKGLGLIGMRERTALLGGTLEIESRPNEGTTVFARVPTRYSDTNGNSP